ncbi:MAG TPA: hypothetical protein VL961_09530 [Acidimicrobiales bacterium]|nr:hypothetical protein [Acidimicrobiales bacterium]
MDIEGFYEADPRRRASAEIELGTEWHDATGTRYELNYVEDTGELYVMREPLPRHIKEDPFGGVYVSPNSTDPHAMTVHVVARIDSVDSLHRIVDGWQEAMAAGNGAEWLADRLRAAGVAVGPDAVDLDGDEGAAADQ